MMESAPKEILTFQWQYRYMERHMLDVLHHLSQHILFNLSCKNTLPCCVSANPHDPCYHPHLWCHESWFIHNNSHLLDPPNRCTPQKGKVSDQPVPITKASNARGYRRAEPRAVQQCCTKSMISSPNSCSLRSCVGSTLGLLFF